MYGELARARKADTNVLPASRGAWPGVHIERWRPWLLFGALTPRRSSVPAVVGSRDRRSGRDSKEAHMWAQLLHKRHSMLSSAVLAVCLPRRSSRFAFLPSPTGTLGLVCTLCTLTLAAAAPLALPAQASAEEVPAQLGQRIPECEEDVCRCGRIGCPAGEGRGTRGQGGFRVARAQAVHPPPVSPAC
jgi:hypothetical protein